MSNPRNAADVQSVRKGESPQDMKHLSGLRTLAALWIVCHHMAPTTPASSLDAFTMRVEVCVELFMILSGFVTQHAFGNSHLRDGAGTLTIFYIRRLGRIVICVWVSVAFSGLLRWLGGVDTSWSEVSGCAFLVTPWVNPAADCPNGVWFIAALVPSWLLYPLVTQRILANLQTASGFAAFAGLSWLVAICPQLFLILWRRGWLSWNDILYTWFWPPAQLADFALGACAAAAVQHVPWDSKYRPILADASMILVMIGCLVIPVAEPPEGVFLPSTWRPGQYTGWDQLSGRVAAPFFAVFFYCSANGNSFVTTLLANDALVGLGAYTLEVYLFQGPIHDTVLYLRKPAFNYVWRGFPLTVEDFLAYLLVLWLFSVVYVKCFAEPLNQQLRATVARWLGHPVEAPRTRGD